MDGSYETRKDWVVPKDPIDDPHDPYWIRVSKDSITLGFFFIKLYICYNCKNTYIYRV